MKRIANDNRIVGMIKMPGLIALKHKRRGREGFTLAETLLAVLILLLVSVIVATGMPAATNAYNKVVLGANAKVMLSTAITALHDELGTAWHIEEIVDGLSYFSASTGAKTTITLNDDGTIWIEEYVSLDTDLIHDKKEATMQTEHKKKGHALVVDPISGMYITCEDDGIKWITYDKATGIVTISGLKVCKGTGTEKMELARFAGENGEQKEFTIRVISKDMVETTP